MHRKKLCISRFLIEVLVHIRIGEKILVKDSCTSIIANLDMHGDKGCEYMTAQKHVMKRES